MIKHYTRYEERAVSDNELGLGEGGDFNHKSLIE